MYESISESSEEKQLISDALDNHKKELADLTLEVYSTQNELLETRDTLNETYDEVELRRSDGIFEMYNPTYSELMDFIRSDGTNRKRYDEETFNCVHYSLEVKNNAESIGMRCGYVTINLSGDYDHAIVAFNTTDRGIIYLEPQSDEVANLEVGKYYWADCVVIRSSRYYYPRDPDDIIQDYGILFW